MIIPTYNNGGTVGRVIEGARRFVDDVIVVEDGSTDGTAEVLARLSGIEVVKHAENQGKGAALRHGFRRAVELGYDHAITIDADEQHLIEDIPRFLEATRKNPHAIWVGARVLTSPGAPTQNGFTNRLCNVWFWAETGKWLADRRCGFRCYPLRSVADLRLQTTGCELEVEVLVKAAWMGIPLESVQVEAAKLDGPDRVSHLRPVRDFLLISHLDARLVVLRLLLPGILRRMMCSRRLASSSFGQKLRLLSGELVDELREGTTSPGQIAASVGLGMCMGILPIWGYQMAAAVLLAHKLRLSKFIALAASNISSPAAIPFILYACIITGRWVLSGQLDYSLGLGEVSWQMAWEMLAEWFVGSIVLALVVGLIGGVTTYVVARLIWSIRAGVRKLRQGADR